MPVRFRCAYCNQLMGISRRKVGTVVTCPKCGGQVVVPAPDPAQEAAEQAAANPAAAFEDNDEVQKLLEYAEEAKPAVGAMPVPRPMPAAVSAPVPLPVQQPRSAPPPTGGGAAGGVDFDVVPAPNLTFPGGDTPLVPARGIWLTPGVVTIMLIFIVTLVGLSFLLGLLLGRSMTGAA
ncbi:MAG: hypothetical protein NZO58_03880 [Gemmataceae bacterium]|nr:hypothetical protein [Gemmataceae bacterium]